MEGLRLDGSVVFWSLSNYTARSTLNHNLQQLGFNQLEQRTAMSVLQDAIEEVHCSGTNFLVRPLNRDKERGYCVVRETKGEHKNDYEVVCSYTIGKFEDIVSYDGTEAGKPEEVGHRFFVLRDTLKPQQVSAMLLTNLRKMNGIRLNPNGFAYWVPDESKGQWMELADAVSKAAFGTTTFYTIGHKFDEQGIVAVKDALVRDVKAEIEEINKDVESGKLRVRALDGRAEQANRLRAKVERYEALLGTALDEIKDQVGEAHFTAAQAALMQAVAREVAVRERAEAQLKQLQGVVNGSEGE